MNKALLRPSINSFYIFIAPPDIVSIQRVAVLHLEERCERAIEWALKIEPSIKHLVIWTAFFFFKSMLPLSVNFPYMWRITDHNIHLVICGLQVVSGGVASNQYVRARLDQVVKKNSLQLVCPPPSLCTDNGKSNFCNCLPCGWG